MGVRRLDERPFGGRVWGYALGPVDVFRVRGDASAIVRTRKEIAQGDPEHLQLALLLRGRLERCRRDLTEPSLADRPVAEIARRWGLREPAHFSRAFRAAYGYGPRDLRRQTR